MKLECGPMPNVIAALPNIGGALCSGDMHVPQSAIAGDATARSHVCYAICCSCNTQFCRAITLIISQYGISY